MLGLLLTLLSWVLAIPLTLVGIECLMAILPRRRSAAYHQAVAPRIAVVVPAHNEAAGIRVALTPLVEQLPTPDRLLVIADNCSDDTAAIARGVGASVLERKDTLRRGKGYALDFAIRYLEHDPPDVVVIIDADCRVQAGTISRLAVQTALTGRPAQAFYRFTLPPAATLRDQISAFAIIVRNIVRPLGAMRLGIPCILQGSGMAFPWRLIKDATLASGNLVEDMQLGVDLAIAHTPAHIVEDTLVEGELPQRESAKTSQRTRWEHGHLQTIITQVPRLAGTAIAQRRLDLLGFALDLAVPPLALLVGASGLFLMLCLIYASGTGDFTPARPCLVGAVVFSCGMMVAQARFAKKLVAPYQLLAAPLYILWKLPIYVRYIWRRQQQWVRTARDS